MPFDTTPREERKPTVCENLIKARSILRRGLWCRHQWDVCLSNGKHLSCAADAIHVALHGDSYIPYLRKQELLGQTTQAHRNNFPKCPEIALLADVIRQFKLSIPDKRGWSDLNTVTVFNDQTSYQRLLLAFDIAIEQARQKEMTHAI